jgi:hypothetical protein
VSSKRHENPTAPTSLAQHLQRHWRAVGILALIVVAGIAAWLGYVAERGSGLVHALERLLPGLPPDEQIVGRIILESYGEYRGDARNWSAVYFGGLFFSAACAAMAGLIVKFEVLMTSEPLKKDLAALLAMLSALLITLSTVGGFHQRWMANRLAAARMERLGYSFITANRQADLKAFSEKIQAISFERNEAIVSGGGEPDKAGPAR